MTDHDTDRFMTGICKDTFVRLGRMIENCGVLQLQVNHYLDSLPGMLISPASEISHNRQSHGKIDLLHHCDILACMYHKLMRWHGMVRTHDPPVSSASTAHNSSICFSIRSPNLYNNRPRSDAGHFIPHDVFDACLAAATAAFMS